MITLYHVNHGFAACKPGEQFVLRPIQTGRGSEDASSWAGWQQAFPAGLSRFGYRHLDPGCHDGDAPTTAKLAMEFRCEQIRQARFAHRLSRYQAFFGLASIEEATSFNDQMQLETGRRGSIWEVVAERIDHRGDMRLLTPETFTDASLTAYWQGMPAIHCGLPIWECVIPLPVTMARCVVA